LDDASGSSVSLLASSEEVEIGLKVIILDLQHVVLPRCRDSLEYGDCLLDAVLKLQVVKEDHLVGRLHLAVDYLLLDERVQEFVVSFSELNVQNLILPVFTNQMGSGVHHGVIF